jgi:hypothetical protein
MHHNFAPQLLLYLLTQLHDSSETHRRVSLRTYEFKFDKLHAGLHTAIFIPNTEQLAFMY